MSKDKRFTILMVLQSIILIFCAVILFNQSNKGTNSKVSSEFKDTALKLHAAGLSKSAAKNYKQYLDRANLNNIEKSKICFTIATLLEDVGDFEQALSYYYLSQILDESSKNHKQASKSIVSLLEKLNKYSAAKMALKQETSLNDKSNQKVKGAKILAEIGDRKVYDYEINKMIDLMPSYMRKNFENKKAKAQLLQKYLADELLYKKAVRQKFDNSDEVKRKIKDVSKQIVVQSFVQSEFTKNIQVNESDVKNYFTANKSKYDQKQAVGVFWVSSKDKKKLVSIKKKAKSLSDFKKRSQSLLKVDPKNDRVVFGETWKTIEASKLSSLKNQKEKSFSKLVVNKGEFYLFYVNQKIPKKEANYDQMKNQIQNDYKTQKQQELYSRMIQDTLKMENVKVYEDRL